MMSARRHSFRGFLSPLILVTVWAFASPFASAADVATLPDGSTLIGLSAPDASDAPHSVALVVAVGAANDPEGKEGLAFLTAHVATEGTALDDRKLEDSLAELGGTLDIRVGMFTTAFVVTAPPSALKDAFHQMVTSLSNPFLHDVGLGHARAKAARLEDEKPMGTVDAQIDQLIFPSLNRGRTPTGRAKSRSQIDGDDVKEFFAKHYVTGAMTWVSATAMPLEEQRKALEQRLAFPPIPRSPPPQERARPNIPSAVDLEGDRPEATLVMRLSDKVTTSDCRSTAVALEVAARPRFSTAPKKDQEGATVRADCRLTRGEHLLVFRVRANKNGSSDVVARMKDVIRTVAGRPIQRKHRAAYRQQALARSLDGAASPLEAVGQIVTLLEHDERPAAVVVRAYQMPLSNSSKIRRVARQLRDAKRRAVIDVSMGMRRNRSRNR